MKNKQLKIGIQLYSVREVLKEDFTGTIKALGKMGFQGVEMAFYYGDMNPDALAALVDGQGFEVCGIYEDFDRLVNENDNVYDYAKALGCRYLTSGFNLQELTDDFPGCVKKACKACEIAATKGLTVCYHAHEHEYNHIGDERILDKLLKEVERLSFEPDTGFLKRGGVDVIDYMQKYVDRIPVIHLKDIKVDGPDTEAGNGIIDAKAVIDFARTENIEWIIYEQVCGEMSSLESAKISLDYLKTL